ncbi:MAG TPA: YceI family protein [Vicinamibacterales bacterium]|nr:YceI family protein [Vicinamibacterales bacterium]
MNHRRYALALAIIVAAWPAVHVNGASQTFRIDPANSRTTIHVGKSGVFSFVAGHSHEVTGPIESGEVDVDPDSPAQAHIRLVIPASELRVSAAGEPEGDAPKVQEAMNGPKVLDVAHQPRILYESTTVTVKSGRGSALDLIVAGRLTIREATRPVTATVHAEFADKTLKATGRFTIKQSAFGITPVSVGGVVAVKDELQIEFSIVATR